MFKRHGSPVPASAAEGRKTKLVTAAVAILSGIVLVCIVLYVTINNSKVKPAGAPAKEAAAELVSASGMILVQNPGHPEWREVKAGARFSEGDLVRTDSSGDAGIRYKNGATVLIPRNTVFKVHRSGDNEMEITASPEATMLPLLLAGENETAGAKGGPFIELKQIIPFGRSLELIGRVEAGSSLSVNGEIVEVSGEGLFKHFMRPFPPSAQVVRLNLKVTDLAGRTRIYTASYDFRAHDEGH